MFKNKSNQQNYEYYENMQLNRIYRGEGSEAKEEFE